MTPLRQRMVEDMQIRNLSPHTHASYCQQISQFARHFGKLPVELGRKIFAPIRPTSPMRGIWHPSRHSLPLMPCAFLYKVTLKKNWMFEEAIPTCKKPQKLPEILSPAEVLDLFACVRTIKQRVILRRRQTHWHVQFVLEYFRLVVT